MVIKPEVLIGCPVEGLDSLCPELLAATDVALHSLDWDLSFIHREERGLVTQGDLKR